jgi:hypothetical protein
MQTELDLFIEPVKLVSQEFFNNGQIVIMKAGIQYQNNHGKKSQTNTPLHATIESSTWLGGEQCYQVSFIVKQVDYNTIVSGRFLSLP